MRYINILIILLSISIFSGCDDGQPFIDMTSKNSAQNEVKANGADLSGEYPNPTDVHGYVNANFRRNDNSKIENTVNRKKIPEMIIKNGDISIDVVDYNSKIKAVYRLVRKFGGYISSENESRNAYSKSNNLSIRVEAGSFHRLVDSLAGLGDNLNYKKIDATDVGEEFVDMQSRLKTKREVEQRYHDILRKAKTIEDIIRVEEIIRRLREEIESVEGRLKYLNDRVAYSTVKLSIYQELDEVVDNTEPGFFSKLGSSLENGWNGILVFIIALGHIWPLIIIIGIALFFILKMIRKGRK